MNVVINHLTTPPKDQHIVENVMVDYAKEYMMSRQSNVREQHKAYYEGFNAENRTDIPDKDALCPYPIMHPVHGLRQQWFMGLYDNRFSKYDHIPSTDDYESSTISQTKTKNMGKHS